MTCEFVFDGWLRASKEAREQNAGCYLLSAGFYDEETKGVTLNLDIILETICYNCGGWCGNAKPICIDKLITQLTSTISHEHIHRILDRFNNGSCRRFDNISHVATEKEAR